jgi:sirohydrochlorin cobaltochelatase
MGTSSGGSQQLGVVLVGHGAPATDCPPQLIGELMSLEWREAPDTSGRHGHQHGTGGRAAELDAKIRNWPRRADNDPYKRGLEQLAAALRPLLPSERFVVAYNEFCRPSVSEAIEGLISQGAARILVIPTMLTPGGVHSEVDIPRALEGLRRSHPGVSLEYVWPFDLPEVATLLAAHIGRAARVGASKAGVVK